MRIETRLILTSRKTMLSTMSKKEWDIKSLVNQHAQLLIRGMLLTSEVEANTAAITNQAVITIQAVKVEWGTDPCTTATQALTAKTWPVASTQQSSKPKLQHMKNSKGSINKSNWLKLSSLSPSRKVNLNVKMWNMMDLIFHQISSVSQLMWLETKVIANHPVNKRNQVSRKWEKTMISISISEIRHNLSQNQLIAQ